MYKSAFIISFSLLLFGCGGSGGNESTNKVDITPTEPPKVIVDHSGLTPLAFDVVDPLEYKSGGDVTLFVSNEDAFSRRPRVIADDFKLDGHFTSGDHLFRTPDNDIGPILNIGSCQGCHLNDGRGVVPTSPTTPMSSMLVKLADDKGNVDPIYGDQIQPFSIQGFISDDFSAGFSKHDGSVSGSELHGEAFPFIEYEMVNGQYPDGSAYQLSFWKKALQPLTTAALVIVAVAFIFGPLRSATMGSKVFTAICFGILFYLVQNLLSTISLVYQLNPLLAVFLPIFFCLMIGLVLLKRLV